MTHKPQTSLMHIAICTSDLDKSLNFYTQALGFEHEREIPALGSPFDQLMELPGTVLHVHQIKLGENRLELVGLSTETQGNKERLPVNQLGFTHMTLTVDDIENALLRIEEFGGKVIKETAIDSPFGKIVFCTDPDGTRIEIMGKIT